MTRYSTTQMPERMTIGTLPDVWGLDEVAGERSDTIAIVGATLIHKMVSWLDTSLWASEYDRRLSNLQLLNPTAFEAHEFAQAGKTTAQIAGQQRCSERTVQMRLRTAERYLLDSIPSDTFEAKLQRLAITDPLAWAAYMFASAGWRQDEVATLHGASVDSVKKAVARARHAVGEPDRRAMRRYLEQLNARIASLDTGENKMVASI